MRFGQVAPVFFGIFVALACGSNVDTSMVAEGTGATNTGATGNGTGNNINTGATGSGATTGNPSGGAGSVVDPNSACATSSADGQAVQVDLYFMVDITGSMNCPVPDNGVACDPMISSPPATGESRWSVVSKALKAFVADPANQTLGVGLKFFPIGGNTGGMMGGGATCNASSYATPN